MEKRAYVPRAEGRVLLVNATIDLLRELPFDEVTVRRIAERANLNTKAIGNIFGRQQDLFIEVTRELGSRFADILTPLPESEIQVGLPVQGDFVLRTKLVSWLIGQGVTPETFVLDPSLNVTATLQARQMQAGLSENAARFFAELLRYLAEGFVMFSGTHETHEGDLELAARFLERVRADLPRLTEGLWSEAEASRNEHRL